ncbi:MAG: hypothetical protein M0006_16010 [Magnetospirillum sp.]|nr:hypothetical protein [Magnetospirillum sp.]
MREYCSIHWLSDDAQLKSYSASLSSRANRRDVTVVRIEIEVTNQFRLVSILEGLAEIRQQQEAAAAPKKRAPKKPLLLTGPGGQS